MSNLNCPVCEKQEKKYQAKMTEITQSARCVINALYDIDDLDTRELEFDIQDLCFALGLNVPKGSIQIKRKQKPGCTQRIFMDLIKATNHV